ncbi:MAG: hypothetical protein JSR17_07085 [Proteobacteria bacterium]|nr:hypothetical protein [Pseudomonadota bacterium]
MATNSDNEKSTFLSRDDLLNPQLSQPQKNNLVAFNQILMQLEITDPWDLAKLVDSVHYQKLPDDFKKRFQERLSQPPQPPYSWVKIDNYYDNNEKMQAKKQKEKQKQEQKEQTIFDRLGDKGQKALLGDPLPPQSQEKRRLFFEKYAELLEKKRQEIDSNPKINLFKEGIKRQERFIKQAKDSIADLEKQKIGNDNPKDIERLDEEIKKHKRDLDEHTKKRDEIQQELYKALPPTNMKEMFNEEMVKLYKEAIEEENNSIEFRKAVFMHATDNFYGPKFSPPVDLTLGGASGTGKSYATKLLIFDLSRKNLINKLDKIAEGYDPSFNPKEPYGGNDQRVKDIIAAKTKITEINPAADVDKAFEAMKSHFEQLAGKFEDDEKMQALKRECVKGNDVVAKDGGKEREMSQVRQVMLHGALSLGYPGISDLHSKSKKLKLKILVKKAALNAESEAEPFNTATPNTFSKEITPSAIKQKDGRRPVVAFVDAYADQTEISGTDRAYRKATDAPYSPENIKANKFPPVESKIYEATVKIAGIAINAFKQGFDNSLGVLKKTIEAGGVECYHLNNKLIHVREVAGKLPPENWVVCDSANRKYDLKLNEVDFERWKLAAKTNAGTPNLNKWYAQQKKEGTLEGIVVSRVQTLAALEQQMKSKETERKASAPPRRDHLRTLVTQGQNPEKIAKSESEPSSKRTRTLVSRLVERAQTLTNTDPNKNRNR